MYLNPTSYSKLISYKFTSRRYTDRLSTVTVLNNVLYGDLTGVFLVVGCTLFISLVNCLSEIFYSMDP